MELITLTLPDLDPERGVVLVREGKGRKDRVVPIGERALAWIAKYLREVRPSVNRCPPAEHRNRRSHRQCGPSQSSGDRLRRGSRPTESRSGPSQTRSGVTDSRGRPTERRNGPTEHAIGGAKRSFG
jgi:integrase